MCLMILGWQVHPRYRLVVAANRDEFHRRPAAPLAPWPDAPGILAGRDLQAGGTWLAVDRERRFGLITNFRDLSLPRATGPSRGELIPRFLLGQVSACEYLDGVNARASEYPGFNLLLADTNALWYASNRADPFARELRGGIYGVSNHLLDTPWPKLERARAAFRNWVAEATTSPEALLDLLGDRTPSQSIDAQSGLSPEWERTLSSPFVLHPEYGTRASTVIAIEPDGSMLVHERRFDAAGRVSDESRQRLARGEWPAA